MILRQKVELQQGLSSSVGLKKKTDNCFKDFIANNNDCPQLIMTYRKLITCFLTVHTVP